MSCECRWTPVGTLCDECVAADDKREAALMASERATGFLACKTAILAHFKKIWAPGVYAELKRNVEEACREGK